MELFAVNKQWASRPDDERFLSLPAMREAVQASKDRSQQIVIPYRKLLVQATGKQNGLTIVDTRKDLDVGAPTNWAFQQLCIKSGAPSYYLRTLPAELAAQNVNHGLKIHGGVEKAQLLTRTSGVDAPVKETRAFTSAKYGRVWDAEVLDKLIDRFGDGATGEWRVPGEWKKLVEVTKENTTLYWSDRSMFIFLCNETNRIEVKNRRDGKAGSMARGFYLWNSEVGAETLGFASFYFDEVCANRIIWGASNFQQVKIRHSKTAPDRFLKDVTPVLNDYANKAAVTEERTIAAAQAFLIGGKDGGPKDVDKFMGKVFGPKLVGPMTVNHMREEGTDIRSLFDVVTASTAYARRIPHTDDRLALETKAGKLLDLVAVDVTPKYTQGRRYTMADDKARDAFNAAA